MRPGLIAILALGLSGLHAQDRWPTLAEIVAKLGTDPAGLSADALAKQITSYATMNEDGEFAVAGWEHDATDGLRPPLYVGLRERGKPWRFVGLPEIPESGPGGALGSVMSISPVGSHLIIDTHLTPSAGAIVVLRRDLTYIARLYGWFLTSLPDGLIVFHRSMIHFAPAHPGELATFDPKTGTESQLYPTDMASPLRKEFIERLRPLLEQWQKKEPDHVYGFDPEWFDVSFGDLQYDVKTDTLTVPVKFSAGRHPAEIAPPQSSQLILRCRPMRSRSRACTEAREVLNQRNR